MTGSGEREQIGAYGQECMWEIWSTCGESKD